MRCEPAYDYIIVGAGSAGSVLAHRLTEEASTRILLLEAGAPDRPLTMHMPAAFSTLFKSRYDWAYDTAPQPHLKHRRLYWPRGKVLGGSSSINAMIYTRGNPYDYDHWQAQGNQGMLSGIGGADYPGRLGISVVMDLPGVGQNLQDHLTVALCAHLDIRAESPMGSIPSLNARVTSVRFFEGPANPMPRAQRVYKTRFEGSRARYVYWELNLEHPAPGRRLPFIIEELWYHQNTLLTRQSIRASVRADWTWSFWHHGFNLAVDGKRMIGFYRVDLYVEGMKVASHRFEMYDATCRGQSTFAEADKVQEYESLAERCRRQGDGANYRATREKLIVAYHNRGGTCYINGNLEAALEHFTKALGIAPDYDLVYRNRGGVRVELGDLRGAIEDYDREIRLDPKDAEYYHSRGMARFWLGELPGALRDLDEAIRLNPKNAEFYEHRGVIRAHLRDHAGAMQDLQHAASLYEKTKKDYDRMQEHMAAVHGQDYSALTLPKGIRSFRN